MVHQQETKESNFPPELRNPNLQAPFGDQVDAELSNPNIFANSNSQLYIPNPKLPIHESRHETLESRNLQPELRNPNLLAPFGEHVKPEHPLLRLDDEFEEIDLLLGIRAVLPLSRRLAGLVDELLEGEVGVLRRSPDEGGEVHRLLP